MIYIFHGENQIELRNELKKLSASRNTPLIEHKSTDISASNLAIEYLSVDIFGGVLAITLDVTKDKNFDFKGFTEKVKEKQSSNLLMFYSYQILEKSHPLLKQVTTLKANVREFHPAEKTNIFAFTDALFEKRKKDAYLELSKLLAKNEDEFEIYNMIVFGIRNISLAKFSSKAFSKLHPFVQQKTTKLAAKFSEEKIKKLYKTLYLYDLEIKTGKRQIDVAIPLLIEEITK